MENNSLSERLTALGHHFAGGPAADSMVLNPIAQTVIGNLLFDFAADASVLEQRAAGGLSEEPLSNTLRDLGESIGELVGDADRISIDGQRVRRLSAALLALARDMSRVERLLNSLIDENPDTADVLDFAVAQEKRAALKLVPTTESTQV